MWWIPKCNAPWPEWFHGPPHHVASADGRQLSRAQHRAVIAGGAADAEQLAGHPDVVERPKDNSACDNPIAKAMKEPGQGASRALYVTQQRA